jgi:AraC-like DNA-binding protein
MPAAELMFLYGESVPRCTHHIDKVFDNYFTLQLMTAGGVEVEIGAEKYMLRGRWFWSAYPGPRIYFHVAGGFKSWRHRYIAFRGPLVERWRGQGLFPIAPQRAPARGDFDQRFDALLESAARSDTLNNLHAANLLEAILIDLAEARSQIERRPPWLEAVLARLDGAISVQEVDYSKVAGAVGMSARTLRRRFVRAMGLGPHEYLLQARSAEARRLLGETDLPVKTIARKLGYRDVYYFSRQFGRLTGVPPATYRRSRQR